MLPKLALVAAALAAAPFLVSAAVYPLAEGHAGKDFFNGWTFYVSRERAGGQEGRGLSGAAYCCLLRTPILLPSSRRPHRLD